MPSSAAQDDEMRGKEINVHHGAVGEVRDLVEARDRWDRRSPTNIDEDPYACAAEKLSLDDVHLLAGSDETARQRWPVLPSPNDDRIMMAHDFLSRN
jgi:hypothetical protein